MPSSEPAKIPDLALPPIRHNHFSGLIIGVPLETFGNVQTGAVETLPGTVNGVSAASSQMLGGVQMAGGANTFDTGWSLGRHGEVTEGRVSNGSPGRRERLSWRDANHSTGPITPCRRAFRLLQRWLLISFQARVACRVDRYPGEPGRQYSYPGDPQNRCPGPSAMRPRHSGTQLDPTGPRTPSRRRRHAPLTCVDTTSAIPRAAVDPDRPAR
jgi:hypothetical protein